MVYNEMDVQHNELPLTRMCYVLMTGRVQILASHSCGDASVMGGVFCVSGCQAPWSVLNVHSNYSQCCFGIQIAQEI